MRETPLADRIPLWRTLHEDGVTALITPALDYVGGLAPRGLDTRFLKDDEASQLGEGLRDLLSGLEEEVTLHFLYRVHTEVEQDLRAYRAGVTETTPAAETLVAAKLDWLRQQPLVRSELFCFTLVGTAGNDWIEPVKAVRDGAGRRVFLFFACKPSQCAPYAFRENR